jgi:DNA-binding response OmpR family regulator
MSDKPLSEILGFYRCERPDEWSMDEFIRGARSLEAKVAELQSKIDIYEKEDVREGVLKILTKTEFRIFAKLDQAEGANVRYEDLAGRGFGHGEPMLQRSSIDRRVHVHVSNLKRKLASIDKNITIKNMHNEGYVMVKLCKDILQSR